MTPKLDEAKPLVETTLHYGGYLMPAGTKAAIYEAPDAGGDATCIFVDPAPLPVGQSQPIGNMRCSVIAKQTTTARPLNASISSTLIENSYHHLVTGEVDPSLHATRIEALVAGERVPLAFGSDYFIGEIAPTSGDLQNTYVVAYDASGKEVAREQVGAPPH